MKYVSKQKNFYCNALFLIKKNWAYCIQPLGTDKTGTLTLNRMTVVESQFGSGDTHTHELNDDEEQITPAKNAKSTLKLDADLNMKHPQCVQALRAAVALNSTAFVTSDPVSNEVVYSGSKTECALLMWIDQVYGGD
jgi:Ca2+-transporting ATPase